MGASKNGSRRGNPSCVGQGVDRESKTYCGPSRAVWIAGFFALAGGACIPLYTVPAPPPPPARQVTQSQPQAHMRPLRSEVDGFTSYRPAYEMHGEPISLGVTVYDDGRPPHLDLTMVYTGETWVFAESFAVVADGWRSGRVRFERPCDRSVYSYSVMEICHKDVDSFTLETIRRMIAARRVGFAIGTCEYVLSSTGQQALEHSLAFYASVGGVLPDGSLAQQTARPKKPVAPAPRRPARTPFQGASARGD